MKSIYLSLFLIQLALNFAFSHKNEYFIEEIDFGLYFSTISPNQYSDANGFEIKRQDISIEYFLQQNNIPFVKGINFGFSYQVKRKSESNFSDPILKTRITYPKTNNGRRIVEWESLKPTDYRINIGIPIVDEIITPTGEYLYEIYYGDQLMISRKFTIAKFDWNTNYFNPNMRSYKQLESNPEFSRIERGEWKTESSRQIISRIDSSYIKLNITEFEKLLYILNISDELCRTSYRIENTFIRYFNLYNGKDTDHDNVYDSGIFIEYIFENDGRFRTNVYYKVLPISKITARKFNSIYFENSEKVELIIENTLNLDLSNNK